MQGFGIKQAFGLARLKQGDVLFEVGYGHENDSTKGTQYDAWREILSAGLEVPIVEKLKFQCGGEWAWEDYKNRSLQDARYRHREDFIQTYSFALIYKLTEQVSLHGQILWTNDDSNILTSQQEAVYSYERVIYGLGLTVGF